MAERIGEWTIDQLVKFLRDYLERDPPSIFRTIQADRIEITESIDVQDQISYPNVHVFKVGMVGGPGFQNSWANAGSSWAVASYWRDPTNVVHLGGAISGGSTGTVAFTLPPGYRPSGDESFVVPTSVGTATVTIAASNGTVTVSFSGTPTWIALSGIRFLSKQTS